MQVIAAAGSLPLWGLLVAALVVVTGYIIVHAVVSRKWGYTPEREKELEDKTSTE